MHMHQELPCACTALRKASRAMTRLYDDALAPTNPGGEYLDPEAAAAAAAAVANQGR